MRVLLPVLLVMAGGCYEEAANNWPNGYIMCSDEPTALCRSGYHCASDNTCWHNGQDPAPSDGFEVDMEGQTDLSAPEDLSSELVPDLAMDMSVPPDLRPMCESSSDCTSSNKPICFDGTCQPCSQPDGGTSSACAAISAAAPYCATSGRCVGCLDASDCAATNQACNQSTSMCDKCVLNTDCASGICGPTGTCIAAANIVFVDVTKCPAKGSGSAADPYCAIEDGITTAGAAGHYVLVQAGSYMEDLAVDATNAAITVNVVGVGAPTIQPATHVVLMVTGDPNMVNLLSASFDGFVLQNATGNDITCTGKASAVSKTVLNLRRSTLKTSGGYGVQGTFCTLNIDQCEVGPDNKAGGLDMFGDGVIQNSLIFRNGSANGPLLGGIYAYPSTKLVIVNDTIVDNAASMMTPAGVNCAANGVLIFNTVAFGNSGASDINGAACLPDHSAFSGASTMGMGTNNYDLSTCQETTLFVSPGISNYHLAIGSGICTLEGVGEPGFGGVMAPAYDLDGNPRPNAANLYDIGAYQSP